MCVGSLVLVGLSLMERHLFMGASKYNGLVQFHSGTRLSFWVGFGMAEGRETVPRCSAEDIFEERGGGGRREGFSGGILCFCMQIYHVHCTILLWGMGWAPRQVRFVREEVLLGLQAMCICATRAVLRVYI